jgi:23S rRNA (guanosine2251-2'-O)-methyltransferase
MEKKGSGGFIYGVQSVRAVLEKRPGEVREVVAAVKGGIATEVARTDRVATEAAPTNMAPTKLYEAKMELVEKARGLGIKVREVTGREIIEIAGTDSSQGIAARAVMPEYAEMREVMEREAGVVAVLDGITDPHNLGAVIRSAEALGASGVVIGKDRSAGLSAVAHKASAGAVEWIPVVQVVNISRALEELKEAGYWVYGADPDGDNDLQHVDFAGKCAIVIGSEGRGIREGVKKHLDFRVKIFQTGRTKSLNASVASAIILYTALRTRR